MYAFSLVLFVAFVCASNPVVKSGSESASFVSNTAALVTPRPQISHEDLRKRQVLVDTCGYLNGISSLSYGCTLEGQECVTNSIDGAAGCCEAASLNECILPTTCIPYASLGYCDMACADNFYIAKCDNSFYPYCFLFENIFPAGTYTAWDCATAPGVVTLYPTPLTNPQVTTTSTPDFEPTTPTVAQGTSSGGGSSNSNSNSNSNNANGNIVNVSVNGNGKNAGSGGSLALYEEVMLYMIVEYGVVLMALYLR